MTAFSEHDSRGVAPRCTGTASVDEAALAGYLYDECDPAERAAIEAHLAVCAACAADVAALGVTRTHLAVWRPPDAALGFRITSAQDEEPQPEGSLRWWQRSMPAWAQAAAAVAIFVAGAAIGMRIAVESGTLQSGSAQQRGAAPAPIVTAPGGAVSTRDLAALEQRIRQEIAELRTTNTAPVQMSRDDARLLEQVRSLLIESERRQERELAVRLSQVVRDLDVQRRVDLARIEQSFGQMEGIIGPELRDQRQMINLIRTASQRPQ